MHPDVVRVSSAPPVVRPSTSGSSKERLRHDIKKLRAQIRRMEAAIKLIEDADFDTMDTVDLRTYMTFSGSVD